MKRWISLCLIFILAAGCPAYAMESEITPPPAAGEASDEVLIPQEESPDFVTSLLAVAAEEIGYEEGGNNFTKYGQWAGDPNAAWCAEFICWCVDQADQRNGTALLNEVYPKYSGQNTGRDWFIARGRFVYRKGFCPDWGYQWEKGADHNLQKNEYIPRAGDLMYFSYNEAGDTEHVALVEYCTRNSMGEVMVHVIEGNNPSAVQRNSYFLDDSQVLGFGISQDRIDTTIRFGNRGEKVTKLQSDLHRIGLLNERHITGTCGSNTRAAIEKFQKEYMPGKTVTGIADRETQQALYYAVIQVEFNDPENWQVE